jgi:predicted HicB family RNase H-like nuclease
MMLRVSPEEHKLFIRCAQARGLSLSGWARMHLLEAAGEQKKAG